ncbi:MAG: DNA-processing protein DprA [Candidatus Buchananbacteria bacterium]
MKKIIDKNELKYWLGFSQISSIGPVRWQKLLNYFPDLKTAWQAPVSQLVQSGLEPTIADQVNEKKKKIWPDFELEKIEKLKIKTVTILEDNYPKILKEIYGCPPLLYYFGDFDLNNDFCLAVVGTRKITPYGKRVTEDLVKELTNAGITIVSGLALGIDACAHQTTIASNGKTIAVLGSGLDQIYPATNRQLGQKIIETGGAIISEFPLGMLPFKSNFPLRNRIISGLSLGTLIIEAGIKSGALITAQFALEQNREVFAVPGNIYSQTSAGPNQLIKQGAKIISQVSDILETLNLKSATVSKQIKEIIPENETEKMLLEHLSAEPLCVDKLVQCTKLNISLINSTLSILEMKGAVKNLGGQTYIKIR